MARALEDQWQGSDMASGGTPATGLAAFRGEGLAHSLAYLIIILGFGNGLALGGHEVD